MFIEQIADCLAYRLGTVLYIWQKNFIRLLHQHDLNLSGFPEKQSAAQFENKTIEARVKQFSLPR